MHVFVAAVKERQIGWWWCYFISETLS